MCNRFTVVGGPLVRGHCVGMRGLQVLVASGVDLDDIFGGENEPRPAPRPLRPHRAVNSPPLAVRLGCAF